MAENATAVVPMGALHPLGEALPLGLPGLVSEAFCERLAESLNAVLFPATWWPIESERRSFAVQFPASELRPLWETLFDEIARIGFRTICVVNGHDEDGHSQQLQEAAGEVMVRRAGVRILAAAPLEPLDSPAMLDGGGVHGRAQLYYLRPEFAATGDEAAAESGKKLVDEGVEAWKNALVHWTPDVIHYFYRDRVKARRRAAKEAGK